MAKLNRASEIIVDPQELTAFIRSSRDVTELAETVLKLENQNHKLENEVVSTRELRSEKTKLGFRRFSGIALALAAGICLQIANVIVKLLDNHHPVNLVFWRYLSCIVPTLPYCVGMKLFKNVNLFSSISVGQGDGSSPYYGNCKLPSKSRNILTFLVVSALGIPVFILRFASLHYLTIADSTVIVYSGSLFTIIFGHFILKEKCAFVTVLISCFTLLGVGVISRPTFFTGKEAMDDDILIGVGITLFSTILAAMYYITTRQLRQVHFMLISLCSGLMGLLIAGIVAWAMSVFKIPEGTREISLIAVLGLVSFLGSSMIVGALKFEEAGTISIVRMVDVLYSFMFQFAWFGVVPDVYSIVGAIIVVTGVSLITFRKILSTLPEGHRLKASFFFLLL